MLQAILKISIEYNDDYYFLLKKLHESTIMQCWFILNAYMQRLKGISLENAVL